jgi:hypothetical protein
MQNDNSFVGKPFSLESAEDHFHHLKKAGISFLKFTVTWEDIEHEGPGIYDEAHLADLRKILIIAEKEEVSILIEPHHDVWSRWTGGGAPAWTLEKLGIKLEDGDGDGDSDTAVSRQCYAEATMLSLFFAGKTYAPDFQIENENAQDWLQNHYIGAFKHVKRRLKNCAALTGWGSFNETCCGFIGHQNLEDTENFFPASGLRPSPWQAICAASGYPDETFNPQGVSIFKNGFSCPWKQAGVWVEEDDAPVLLRANHFSLYQGHTVNFTDDFLKPFTDKLKDAVK